VRSHSPEPSRVVHPDAISLDPYLGKQDKGLSSSTTRLPRKSSVDGRMENDSHRPGASKRMSTTVHNLMMWAGSTRFPAVPFVSRHGRLDDYSRVWLDQNARYSMRDALVRPDLVWSAFPPCPDTRPTSLVQGGWHGLAHRVSAEQRAHEEANPRPRELKLRSATKFRSGHEDTDRCG
jgi:hypothetical protein